MLKVTMLMKMKHYERKPGKVISSFLKKLRRRRRRAKLHGKVIPIDIQQLKNYASTMRKLWLPNATTIRNSCSREVIGFGKSKGIGYIAYESLFQLLSLPCRNKVLIRNTNSRQYRLGTIEIVHD
ncbi:hypothetical protein NQ317_014194 [Molorchus minor]|uniref:POP1 C-terminal domain-containing protein n=1 Tax=Molorchus minor TaxID=1323400 RepID=A0ABQ9JIU3_9CUCU|nr:hypothetical protein NQ317_014194 [Molorchus minor]